MGNLEQKVKSRVAKVGVIGLGHVGLPLSLEFAKAGFEVLGIDADPRKVEVLNTGKSCVLDVSDQEIKGQLKGGRFRATRDFNNLSQMDCISICVPTPLRKNSTPDVSCITTVTNKIRAHLRRGQLIILESTVYPGATQELLLPILENKGLKAGRDFFLAFSPERIDPGNKQYNIRNVPKVVAGITPRCRNMAYLLYKQIVKQLVPASSTTVAETAKLLENTFRCVNIAFVNEMAQMCHKLGIDIGEVVQVAKTKPFGYMAFYPGPGVGGPCIPIDPMYLSWKAGMSGFDSKLTNVAIKINSSMPQFVVERTIAMLKERRKSIKGSHVHLLGVTYKRDIDDVRESPALDVLGLLSLKGARVSYSDPYIPELVLGNTIFKSTKLTKSLLNKADCTVILADHSSFDYSFVVRHSSLIFDTRNTLRAFKGSHIFYL